MNIALFVIIAFCSVCQAVNFFNLLTENHEEYQNQIAPIFEKYSQAIDRKGDLNVRAFLSKATDEDVMKVLVVLKRILPTENCKELRIMEQGFYLFIFKAKPLRCAEYLMGLLPNGPNVLTQILRTDFENSFKIAHEVVSSQNPNHELLLTVLRAYSNDYLFVNNEIHSDTLALASTTYLLHKACELGKVEAVRLLLTHGADPRLLAGLRQGSKWNALYYALKDSSGIGTLKTLLEHYRFNMKDEEIIRIVKAAFNSNTLTEEIKERKLNLLKEFNLI